MFSTKKAQGMSLNTVIIAIIVLVVLVVLVMIFTGYFGKIFTPGVKSCQSMGGECKSACTLETKTAAGNVIPGDKVLDSYSGDATAEKAGCTAGTKQCCMGQTF